MKKILYILLFLSSWGYSQQEIELCGDEKTHSYWAPYIGIGTTEWTLTGNNLNQTLIGNEITLTWSDSGTYVLEATRWDGPCPSNTVSYTIVVRECDDLIYWVPNTFTPDGDSDNEEWGPVFTAGYDPNTFHIIVLNRWGNTVWESYNIDAKWDGTYDNKQCQEGVYTWVMKFNLPDSSKKIKKHGHVTLIR
jgi:gliding motility-associated-like protein